MNNSETRMQEAIYDISLNVAGFMKQDWWRGMPEDSRMVFDLVVECARFYENCYPEDDPDYLEHIDMLALAWFKDEAHVTLTDEEQTYLWDYPRIAEQIRKHIPDGWNDYDYDCWCHLEYVADDQVTADEYHILNGKFDDLMELDVKDREKIRKMLHEIRNPEKTWEITITQTHHVTFTAYVKARSEQEAIEEFDHQNGNGKFEKEWRDATDYAEVTDEDMTVEPVSEEE